MLLPLLLATVFQAAPADTLSGTWQLTGEVMGKPLDEVCTLSQAGPTLTGTCKQTGADAKSHMVTGEVKAGRVTFSHDGDHEGTTLTVSYTGMLASAKELRGTLEVQPFGVSGTFTATPAAPAMAPAAGATTPVKP
jgi:hypothetical protein